MLQNFSYFFCFISMACAAVVLQPSLQRAAMQFAPSRERARAVAACAVRSTRKFPMHLRESHLNFETFLGLRRPPK